MSVLKLGAIAAVIGAVVAGAGSFALPRRYVSSAVMRIQPNAAAARRFNELRDEILSRASIAEIVQRPELDLYPERRRIVPVVDIVADIRDHDARIELVEPSLFRISFEYTEPHKAQDVVKALIAGFQKDDDSIAVANPASLPGTAIAPDRVGITAGGFGAGLALGLMIGFLRRRPLRWTWLMGTSALAGFIAAAAVTMFFPDTFSDSNLAGTFQFAGLGAGAGLVVCALVLRDRAAWRTVPYIRLAAAGGGLCAIAAGFLSFTIPERYVSTSVMRLSPDGPVADRGAAQRYFELQQEILSTASLAELIQRPSMDLYRGQRDRHPIEEVVNQMRRDIGILPATGARRAFDPIAAFSVSFESSDPHKAQAVVRELITKFTEGNVSIMRDIAQAGGTPDLIKVEVVEPATLPDTPVSPNRLIAIAAGLGTGALLGLLAAFLLRRPPGRARVLLQRAALGGAVCALAAFAIALAIPERYVSTAVLSARTMASRARLQKALIESFSQSSISELASRIYHDSSHAAETLGHLHVEPVAVSPIGAGGAFAVSFEAADPTIAQAIAWEIVAKITEHMFLSTPRGSSGAVQVVDAPKLPEEPVGPSRLAIAVAGLVAGLFIGPFAARAWPLRDFVKPALPCAILGAAAAALVSLGTPDGDVATAGILVSSAAPLRIGAHDPAVVGSQDRIRIDLFAGDQVVRVSHQEAGEFGQPPASSVVERFHDLQQAILSRGVLEEVILRPSLDLYRGLRDRQPLEQAVRQMRERDLRLQPVTEPSPFSDPTNAFRISFRYPNRRKALAVVDALAAKTVELNISRERDRHQDSSAPGDIAVDILGLASFPEVPSCIPAVAVGFGAGAVFGLLLAALRCRPQSAIGAG